MALEKAEEKTVIVADDENVNQPMEVVLDDTAGTVEEKPAEKEVVETKAESQPTKKAKEPGRSNQTIVRLKQERNEMSEAAQRLADENSRLKDDMANLSRAGMANYERGLIAEQKLAQRELEDAIKSEDPKAQAEAQAAVARVAADQRDVDAWKLQNPAPTQQQQRQPEQQQQRQQQQKPAPIAEEVRDWISTNSDWFDERSSNYDADKHFEAVEYARTLENRLTRQGKGDQINSPWYFEQIDNHIASYKPDGDEGEEEVAQPQKKPVAAVAGVSRQSPSQQAASSQKVTLTADEVGMIRKMVIEKAVKYPSDHPEEAKRGRVKSFDDAIKDFARTKRSLPAHPQAQQR